MAEPRSQRLPIAERRESILAAASAVFGERGYAGATTDAVAAAAGVSQAYIVRIFGSKEALFAETATRALDRIVTTFRSIAADVAEDEHSRDSLKRRLARAYFDLVADRGILLTVMHLFALGHHPTLGPIAREGLLSVYRTLRDDAGLDGKEVETFLARGMLVNTMLAARLPDLADADSDARELLSCTLEDATEEVVALTAEQAPLSDAERGRAA